MHRINTDSGDPGMDCTYNNLFKNSNTTGAGNAAQRIADEARNDLA